MRYIKDFEEGNKIRGVYYVKSKVSTETKNGKPYDNIDIQDKTGVINGKVWEPYSPGIKEYETGDFVEITGEVKSFNGAKQLHVSALRKCTEDEYDPSDYMPVTSKNIDEMYARLIALVDSIENKHLKQLLESFFKDAEFEMTFRKASAAKTVHHAFIGGLLQHTLTVAELCDYMCKNYPILKRDLLITCALLHDVGKTKELSPFPSNDYTDDGQLIGHIIIGAQMAAEKMNAIEGFPKGLFGEVEHCILAHHGELEYGSPKKPALVEAMALSLADNMDAKIETFTEFLNGSDSDDWMGFNKFLDSNIRRTGKM